MVTAAVSVMLLAGTLSACAAGMSRLTRIPVAVMAAALGAVGWQPSGVPMGGDPYSGLADAAHYTAEMNAAFRAAYVVKSAARINQSVQNGRSLDEAVQMEKRFLASHQQAELKRQTNAHRVDTAAATYGPELGWYATLDSRTDRQCRAANGNNFLAYSPPVIGYPGSVHMWCRCVPGPRHPRGRRLR